MSFARSFAEGLKTGVSIYQTAEEAKDRKKRTAMEEERAAREKERFDREKKREDAAKEQADALVALQQARESGTGIFESLRREPTPTGIAPPPAGQSPLGAPSAPNTTGITPPDVMVRPLVTEPAPVGVELPADGSPTPPPRMGLQGTQSGAAESVAPEMRGAAADAPAQKPAEFNLFKSGGEGLYRNQREADRLYYSELEKIYTKLYSSTGQYEKLPAVKDTVRKMRETEFDPMRKMTAAALISGNIKAFEMFNRASAVTDFGYTIDASGASYDNATKTFKGLKFVDKDGNATVQDMSVAEGLAFLNQMDPAKVLEYVTNRDDKAYDRKRQDAADNRAQNEFDYKVSRRSADEETARLQNSLIEANTAKAQADASEALSKAGYYDRGGKEGLTAGGLKLNQFRPLANDLMPKDPYTQDQLKTMFGDERDRATKANQTNQERNRKVVTQAEAAWRRPENADAPVGVLVEAGDAVVSGRFDKFYPVKGRTDLVAYKSETGEYVYMPSSVIPQNARGGGSTGAPAGTPTSTPGIVRTEDGTYAEDKATTMQTYAKFDYAALQKATESGKLDGRKLSTGEINDIRMVMQERRRNPELR